MNKVFKRRFEELEDQASQVESSKETHHSEMIGSGEFVDNELLLSWKVKVRNLLSKVCGENSQYFKQFEEEENGGGWGTNYGVFKGLKAIFLAAKEDFEGGYSDTKSVSISLAPLSLSRRGAGSEGCS